MSGTKKFERKQRRNGPSRYFYEIEEKNDDPKHPALPYQEGKTLYAEVESYERKRIFGEQKEIYGPHQLEQLKKEINLRVKITKNEIFKIGELLIHAKNLCQQEGIKFQEWISKNFDFSYETANNFMNVYKNCFGFRSIAMSLKPSILYQISAPSFPEELRNYLFDADNLNKITNGKLKEIVQKYKEGGFEAIQDDIEEFNRGLLIEKQTLYTLDEVENALRTLESLVKKIEMRGISHKHCPRFEDQIENDEPE